MTLYEVVYELKTGESDRWQPGVYCGVLAESDEAESAIAKVKQYLATLETVEGSAYLNGTQAQFIAGMQVQVPVKAWRIISAKPGSTVDIA